MTHFNWQYLHKVLAVCTAIAISLYPLPMQAESPNSAYVCSPTMGGFLPYQNPPTMDDTIVNTAIADLWNIATRAQSALPGSLRVQDFDAAIASNRNLVAHFDEIGYWSALDSNLLALRDQVLSYQFSEADVVRVQDQYRLRGVDGFPADRIRQMLQVSREDKVRAFDELARLGSREVFQTRVIQQLEIERAWLFDGPSGGCDPACWRGVCNNLSALAAYDTIMCLAGCAPCCAAAPFLGLAAFLCHLLMY